MPATRTVIDQRAMARLNRALAEGLGDVASEIIARTRPPDEPPEGQGLVREGAWGAWLDGERIAGEADPPPGADLSGPVAYAGFPEPARFNEIGTVHQPARPFFSPAIVEVLPGAPAIIARRVQSRIGGRP